jgi:hypothetical protein
MHSIPFTTSDDPRSPDKRGSPDVNRIISSFIQHGRKVPARTGDVDPHAVVAAWTAHGEPTHAGWVVFDLAWLDE